MWWLFPLFSCAVWARLCHCANPTLQLKLSLKKNSQGDNLSPSKFREKLKRKHTQRVLFQYRNCKLKQNVESIFYRAFKVHSKVTFQSCSTDQICLMLKQVWWMHGAIFTVLFTNMWTLKFKSHPHNCFFHCCQS